LTAPVESLGEKIWIEYEMSVVCIREQLVKVRLKLILVRIESRFEVLFDCCKPTKYINRWEQIPWWWILQVGEVCGMLIMMCLIMALKKSKQM
jgi:hypothetical protein